LQNYGRTRQILFSFNLPHFYDFSRLFQGRKEQYYLDSVHVSEQGNEVIGKKITELIHEKN